MTRVKTVAEKLLIRPGSMLWMSRPDDAARIEPLPGGVTRVDDLAQATVAVLFADDARSVRDLLTAHRPKLAQPTGFWVAYPKGNKADINRDTLWPILAEYGMRPVSQVSVDNVWSALRFRTLEADEPPFTGGR